MLKLGQNEENPFGHIKFYNRINKNPRNKKINWLNWKQQNILKISKTKIPKN